MPGLPRPRLLTPLFAAIPCLFIGCGGSGTETSSATTPPDATAQAQAGPGTGQPSAQGKDEGKLVTPEQQIDTKQLTETVKAEVKGGEATEGPTPSEYRWLPADKGMIHDDPLTVEVPSGLQPLTPNVVVPASNPMTKGKVELGRQLYFDPRISKDGTVSYATCHNPEKGWTDNFPTSVGIFGQVGSRNAPTVINTAYGRSMFWDGRAPSLEGQAQGPIQNKIEMGEQTYEEIVKRLREISGYREQFHKVFGTDVTLDGMAKAIAAFERTVLSGNSAYDKYIRGDAKALTDSQKLGMVLFGLRLDEEDEFNTDAVKKLLKKANCTSCHVGFNFSDEQFHNLGVGWDEKTSRFRNNDLGRWAIAPIGAKNDVEIGAFKTPTIRDATRTAPYMHDGSEKTLEDVVNFYDRGGNANPYLDKDIKKLGLSDSEKADLVAFLKAVTGDEIKVELPKLPVGPDGKSPDPRAVFTPPAKQTALEGVFHPGMVR